MRDEISNLVNNLQDFDKTEKEHKSYTLDWIHTGAGLFRLKKPSTPSPHLVSYFLPYDKSTNKILLVDHKKANLWLPPGGHVEDKEHPKQAAIREASEELFITPEFFFEDPFFLSVNQTGIDHIDISLWYVLKGDSQLEYKFDEREFHKIKWFDVDEVPFENTDPHLKRFLLKLENSINNTDLVFFD